MRFLKHAFVFVVFLLATPLLAADGSWSLLGPDGGTVRALAVDPATPRAIYAGTQGEGVFKSLDGGDTWSRSGSGLPKSEVNGVNAFAFDARRHTILYAAVSSYGVYKSTDGGASWLPVRRGMGGSPIVVALAADPHAAGVVYAGTDRGVYKTTDGGGHWRLASSGLTALTVTSLAIDPKRPAVLYAATSSGVFKSANGGTTWKPSSQGLPEGAPVQSLAVDPRRSATLYAGGFGRVYKSVDGGASWTPAGSELTSQSTLSALAIDPADPRTLFASSFAAGIYRSDDAGVSWFPVDTGLTNTQVWTLAVDPRGSALFAGTGDGGRIAEGGGPGGVFTTADGRTWQRTVRGLVASAVRTVAAAAGDPLILWAATDSLGLFRGSNGGRAWSRIPISGLDGELRDIAVDPASPGTVYVLASSQATPGFRLFKTADSGATWARLSPPPFSSPLGVKVDPRTGAVWLFGYGLERSVDGGATWTAANGIEAANFIQDVTFDPSSPQTLYASGFLPPASRFQTAEARLYRSRDGGATWNRLDPGGQPGAAQKVAVSPSNPRVLYVAVGGRLWRSTDAGASWQAVAEAPQQGLISDLLAGPDGTLYAATNTGVYASPDGLVWTALNDGLASLAINDLELAPGDPGTLYAATENGGVEVRTGLSRP
jgi:photosystem II stability/assembly factor-like uncharacterized protein